ncbi:MAG: flagellar biosynthetic protein FliR [Myxococcales bacterium]|nr:MAG: flagellar biosynthetic protein FliR [Myxococcales bacterium]
MILEHLIDPASQHALLWTALLLALRITPLFLLSPWLTLGNLPWMIRASLAFGFLLALFPLATSQGLLNPPTALELPLIVLREFGIGLLFAIASAVPFWAMGWAGQLSHHWQGFSFSDNSSGGLQKLFFYFAIALFASMGGLRFAVDRFAQTLLDVPLAGVGPSNVHLQALALGSSRLVADALWFTLLFATPVAATLVLSDLSMGWINRISPQFSAFFLSVPLKTALSIFAIMISLAVFGQHALDIFQTAVVSAKTLILEFAR